MKKKADWKEDLKKYLSENRQAVGLALAGGVGGLVGGTLLPGLIYKKPTGGSRLMLGGGTGALTMLATMLAMRGEGKQLQQSLAEKGKNALSTIKSIPDALLGGRPSAKKLT